MSQTPQEQDERMPNPASDHTELTEAIRRKYFVRLFKDTRRWINTVHQPANADLNSFGQLYSDCFTHHNDVRYAPTDEEQFHFQNDPRRIVRKNNLTAYFQRRFFGNDPTNYKSAPIYQSPNYVETESELGEPTDFDYFYRCIVSTPFDPNDRTSPTLGENRVTFLIGNVGIGKTFVISRVAQKIAREGRDDHGFVIIPVYACLETFVASHDNTNDSPELVRLFLLHFYDLIRRSVKQFLPQVINEFLREVLSRDATSENICLEISEFIKHLARSASTPARVVAFVDNLDVLHYQNSRYIFFPAEYTKHRRFIEEKIVKLIFTFVDPSMLGDSGICACITARHNVARESRIVNQPALPRRMELNDHLVFQLGAIDALDVVKSRLNMYERVIQEYATSNLSKLGDLHYSDKLGLLKASTGNSVAPDNLSDGLRRVSELSHHGARSLVDFLGKLRLNLLKQSDAVDRLFGHSPWLLERLYIANMHQRYSQFQGHFPNVFLVDGTINEERIEGAYHKHTYWLKYLLLRRIGLSEASGISVQDLLDEFVNHYGYEDKIVRLSLGSLAMVNESRCIEIIGAAQDECQDNLVRLTSRGQLLVGSHPKFRFPYCFEFSYLQMVIDDHLMSIPHQLAQRIAIDTSINYALEDNERYYPRMRADLAAKLPATLAFLRMIEAAWTEECLSRRKLAAAAMTLGPNFEKIYQNLTETVKKIAAQVAFDPNKLLHQIEELRIDTSFDKIFSDYSNEFNIERSSLVQE